MMASTPSKMLAAEALLGRPSFSAMSVRSIAQLWTNVIRQSLKARMHGLFPCIARLT